MSNATNWSTLVPLLKTSLKTIAGVTECYEIDPNRSNATTKKNGIAFINLIGIPRSKMDAVNDAGSAFIIELGVMIESTADKDSLMNAMFALLSDWANTCLRRNQLSFGIKDVLQTDLSKTWRGNYGFVSIKALIEM